LWCTHGILFPPGAFSPLPSLLISLILQEDNDPKRKPSIWDDVPETFSFSEEEFVDQFSVKKRAVKKPGAKVG
jgi:hypothetical protein